MTDYEVIVLAVRHNIHGETTDAQAIAFANAISREAIFEAALRASIHSQYPITTEYDRGYAKAREDAADAIRALSQKEV